MISLSLCVTGWLLSLASSARAKQLPCNADDIPTPEYHGTQVTKVEAKEVHGYNQWDMLDGLGLQFEKKPVDFCNVTFAYTHPGLGDTVYVYVWLPLENWNGNLLGMGGGGWAAGSEGYLAPAVAMGYAGINTDAGHSITGDPMVAATQAGHWAAPSPGNIHWTLLQNFASTALDDMTNLGKDLIAKFYGKPARHSYWNGCSTGGRQGLIQAQRYPTNYDGIVAIAPAINWDSFLVAELWGQYLMRAEKYYPPTCELEAIRKAAIDACDEIDGVKNGVIAAQGLCKFDANTVVGQKFDCNGETRKISKSAAKIVNSVWQGPMRNGKLEWYGLAHETPMSDAGMLGGLLQSACDEKGKNCHGVAFPISKEWLQIFLARDQNYDMDTMTEDDFFMFLHISRQRYASIMGSADPDLSEFRAAGGKMITWHGLADELIFPNGTANYYERVLELDPKTRDFYRYFEAPGVGHCMGGVGAFPGKTFNALVDWVENGKAPDTLDAAIISADKDAVVKHRPLCVYPKVAAYKGGSPDDASSFECADAFGTMKAVHPEHSEL